MLKEKILKFSQHKLVTVFKGNLFSKIILSIGGLILAKYFGTEAYGQYAYFLSICGILSILLTVSLEHLMIVEKEEKQKINNLFFSIIISFILAIIVLVISFLIPQKPSPQYIFTCAVLSSFLILSLATFSLYLSQIKKFKIIANITIIDSLSTFVIQSIFAYLDIKNGLIYGTIIGSFIAILYALKNIPLKIIHPNWQQFFESIKNNLSIIKYTYPSTLVNAFGNNLLPILLALYFTKEILGQYAIAMKMITTPFLIISSSFATIYYPKASELFHFNKMRELFSYTKKTSWMNFLSTLAISIVIILIGTPIINFYYGEEWNLVTQLLILLAIGLVGRSLVNPISNILIIVKKNYVSLIFNIYLVISIFIAIEVSRNQGIFFLTLYHSLLVAIGYFILYIYIRKLLAKNE